ncbi:MAG TPA: hypothetical protein VKR23_03455 [Gaiellaceae bacterium]|nr:hypothetical protein [Gaiellaceae bacterium]
MKAFVDECRREWKRLHVPDDVANEMAADLEVDLAEAAEEGASPEDVLGYAVFDPRSFAEAWARERGVVPLAPDRPRVPALFVGALAAFLALAVAGAVVLAAGGGSSSTRVAVAAFGVAKAPPRFQVLPKKLRTLPGGQRVVVPSLLPRFRIAPAFAPRKIAVAGGGGPAEPRAGFVLLAVGLFGAVVTLLSWLWIGRGRRGPALAAP